MDWSNLTISHFMYTGRDKLALLQDRSNPNALRNLGSLESMDCLSKVPKTWRKVARGCDDS